MNCTWYPLSCNLQLASLTCSQLNRMICESADEQIYLDILLCSCSCWAHYLTLTDVLNTSSFSTAWSCEHCVQRQGSDVAECRGGKKIEESYTWMSSSLLQGEWSHPFAGQCYLGNFLCSWISLSQERFGRFSAVNLDSIIYVVTTWA